ncbi:hypothetical protein JGK42_002099 [Aeromonas veronii]|nr:hypothetical protein [Aeromonas veronii]
MKTSEGIQHKSVGQFQLRINAFVTWAKGVCSGQLRPDHLAALKQFFRWCVVLDYCSRHPFDGLVAGKKVASGAVSDAFAKDVVLFR